LVDLFEDKPGEKQPLLIVISGPSGVGKDSVIDEMKVRQVPFHFVVTATTRPPRTGEIDGVDYIFVSPDRFAEMIQDDELLEYSWVYDAFKGVPKEQVRQALASGKDVVMRVDVQGAAKIRHISPGALLIFLTAENEEDLIRRLKKRRTETPEQFDLRIKTARNELERMAEFDYVVINPRERLDEAVDAILAIIAREHARKEPRKVAL
jgi:guanylate kinase